MTMFFLLPQPGLGPTGIKAGPNGFARSFGNGTNTSGPALSGWLSWVSLRSITAGRLRASEPATIRGSGTGPMRSTTTSLMGIATANVQWRTGTTSARRYDIICGSDTPRPAPPTSNVVRGNFILSSNGRALGGIQSSNEPGLLPFGREMVGVQDAIFVLLRFRMSLDTMPKAEKHPRTTVLYNSLDLILSNSAMRAWASARLPRRFQHSTKGTASHRFAPSPNLDIFMTAVIGASIPLPSSPILSPSDHLETGNADNKRSVTTATDRISLTPFVQ